MELNELARQTSERSIVSAVSDEELKKRLLEKGNTLTRVEATAIGKAYESTKLEVQEYSAQQPAKECKRRV